jgi:hypothetical protein
VQATARGFFAAIDQLERHASRVPASNDGSSCRRPRRKRRPWRSRFRSPVETRAYASGSSEHGRRLIVHFGCGFPTPAALPPEITLPQVTSGADRQVIPDHRGAARIAPPRTDYDASRFAGRSTLASCR